MWAPGNGCKGREHINENKTVKRNRESDYYEYRGLFQSFLTLLRHVERVSFTKGNTV